jgi:4-alpha-glucanotransferase
MARALPGWPVTVATWTSTKSKRASCRCSRKRRKFSRPRATIDSKLAVQWAEFEEFCKAEADWLVDYAYYAVLRKEFNTGAWTAWPEPVRKRKPEALAQIAHKHGRALAVEQVMQFAFSKQWIALRKGYRAWNPHPGRRGNLCEYGFGRRVDASGFVRTG